MALTTARALNRSWRKIWFRSVFVCEPVRKRKETIQTVRSRSTQVISSSQCVPHRRRNKTHNWTLRLVQPNRVVLERKREKIRRLNNLRKVFLLAFLVIGLVWLLLSIEDGKSDFYDKSFLSGGRPSSWEFDLILVGPIIWPSSSLVGPPSYWPLLASNGSVLLLEVLLASINNSLCILLLALDCRAAVLNCKEEGY
jgi:hypothetical protein